MKRIGIVGTGGIGKGAHIAPLSKLSNCKITALCDIDEKALSQAAESIGLDKAHCFYDYKELIDCDDVDAVEICTPNHMHVPIAEYAVSKGKPINVEKPLGLSADETKKLESLLKETGLTNMMCFSYRFRPAVRYAKQIIDRGLIGDVVGISVEYLKSSAFWEGRRLDWRFVKKYAGTGVLGDLGAHLIDMAQLLVGDITSVSAMAGTIVKKRLRLDCDEYADVETDDYCNFIANIRDRRTGGDVPANFAITRCAIGHNNTIKYDIFGTDGMIAFNLNDPTVLGVCIGEVDKQSDGLHTVKVPAGFDVAQEEAFVNALHGDFCDYFPTIADGIKCQKVIDALLKSSEEKVFVNIQ